MARLKLKHVDTFTDQTGRVRFYFRRGKGPRVVLPGLPGEAVFMAAYQKALDGDKPEAHVIPQRGAPGSFAALLHLYFASSDYARLAPSTRRAYRLAMDRYIKDEGIGHRLVREMRREHVSRMVTNRAKTPGAANDLLKKLRILVRFAIDNGWRPDDPTLRIKSFAEGEWHTWTEDEICREVSLSLIRLMPLRCASPLQKVRTFRAYSSESLRGRSNPIGTCMRPSGRPHVSSA